MISIYYFFFSLTGFFLAYLYGRHTKRFLWREYFAILAAPILGVLGLILILGLQPLYVFIVGSFVGPALEWLVGLFYHKTIGSHLWIYERYPAPGRYTSYLTIPIWGFGLTLLWLIAKNF